MTRYLFVSLPLAGHLDWGGMLATAAALAGNPTHQVAWASGPEAAGAIGQAGLAFVELSHTGWNAQPHLAGGLPVEQRNALRQARALDSWLSPAAVLPAVAELRAIFQGWVPDIVVLEPYAAAAALAAEANELPIVVCGRPALTEPAEPRAPSPAGERVQRLCAHLGVDGRWWDPGRAQIRSPQLHVDYFSRRWYADLPGIAPQTCFVGARRGSAQAPAPADPPTVLVTLGSLFRDDPAFFRVAAEAVLLEGARPLVVTGGRADEQTGAGLRFGLPAGCDVRGWVDFDAVMPQLAGVIHHGGVGTTHAALRHGLPQVAVPHAGDQLPQAGRITQAEVGFGVRPADFTPAAARWCVHQMLLDRALRTRAAAWQHELDALGGIDAATRAIEAAFRHGESVV